MTALFGIRTPANPRPFLWTDDEGFACRMARRAHGEVIGPLPPEEAHALGASYSGRFAGSMLDYGVHVIYLPDQP